MEDEASNKRRKIEHTPTTDSHPKQIAAADMDNDENWFNEEGNDRNREEEDENDAGEALKVSESPVGNHEAINLPGISYTTATSDDEDHIPDSSLNNVTGSNGKKAGSATSQSSLLGVSTPPALLSSTNSPHSNIKPDTSVINADTSVISTINETQGSPSCEGRHPSSTDFSDDNDDSFLMPTADNDENRDSEEDPLKEDENNDEISPDELQEKIKELEAEMDKDKKFNRRRTESMANTIRVLRNRQNFVLLSALKMNGVREKLFKGEKIYNDDLELIGTYAGKMLDTYELVKRDDDSFISIDTGHAWFQIFDIITKC